MSAFECYSASALECLLILMHKEQVLRVSVLGVGVVVVMNSQC